MRVCLVEDEPLARQHLRRLLAQAADVEVVGEAADGHAAVVAIEAHRPDLVFLDVRLPELSGLEVLDRLEHRPAIVFTTAYDHYAVTAFELEAVDYLVKPFGAARLTATLDRVRRRLAERSPVATAALETARAIHERPLRRLFARRGERIVPLPVERIDRIEGADDYARILCGRDRYFVALRLQDLEQRLDPDRFLRIHRSHIVNLERIEDLRAFDAHRLAVRLVGGDTLVASRAGSLRLRERMR